MKKALLAVASLSVLLAMSSTSQASDHADGVKTALDMTGDISDLYAFTSPSNPSKLVLVMNTHMLATRISRFSDRISYNFRIKKVESVATLKPVPGGDHTISCSFKGGSPGFVRVTGPRELAFPDYTPRGRSRLQADTVSS